MINEQELQALAKELSACDTDKKVIESKNIFNKKHLTPLYEALKSAVDKKSFGQNLNELKQKIETLTQHRIDEINSTNDVAPVLNYNPYLNLKTFKHGSPHLLNTVIDEIVKFFNAFNFELVSGNELTTSHYNFDALNMGVDHPAREMHDSFYLNSELLLRTHCTSTTAIYLEKNHHLDDIRVFSYGNVYRRDEDDATHSHQFTQVDFVWVRDNLTLANLKYLINNLIKYLFGDKLDVRYRLSYFPFTEPSFEVDVQCWKCLEHKQACSLCKQTGWIEILGAGMINQAVLECAGIKHIKTGIAAGLGIERITMLKYGISDIRDLYNNDFEINQQFRK